MIFAISPLLAINVLSTWTLAVGGDIMLNQVSTRAERLKPLKAVFSQSDVAIANLEIPLTTQRRATNRKTPEMVARRDQFILKADPGHAIHLKGIGFDGFSLANNHAMDYRFKGLQDMASLLRRQRIATAGSGENFDAAAAPVLVDSGKARFAMLSFLAFMSSSANDICGAATPSSPGIATLKFNGVINQSARNQIRLHVARAKNINPFVVVMLHWGLEKKTVPTSYQVSLARAWIDAGADLVVGHHPHVLQGGEIYAGKPILYSMGNLISPRPASTAVAILTFKDSKLTKIDWIPCRIANGKTQLLIGTAAQAEYKRFQGLNAAIDRQFKGPKRATLGPLALKLISN